MGKTASEEIKEIVEVVPASEIDTECKYYYLVGIKFEDGGKTKKLDFVFDYTAEDLNAAMMEEIQFNSASEEERKEMKIVYKKKFTQAFLLAMYQKENKVMICLFRSDEKFNREELQKCVDSLSIDRLKEGEVPLDIETKDEN